MTTHTKHPAQSQDNSLAIVSLVLGVLSLTGFGPLTGIPAIITGVISLKNPTGKAMAIAGIVTGAIATIATTLLILLFLVIVIMAAASTSPDDYYDVSPIETHDSSHTRSM